MSGDLTLLMRDNENVKTEYSIPDYLEAPVKADSKIGDVKYYVNGQYYATIPIYTSQDIPRINFTYCFRRILDLWNGNYDRIDQ
jgi:D-alanyl-D-alanine carboxypeptidase (penicillin-binding protein 5/6)